MSIIRFIFVPVMLAMLVFACDPKPVTHDGKVKSEAPTEVTTEVTTDASNPTDTKDKIEKPPGDKCVSARDCPNGDCVKGKCVKTDICQGHDECNQDERCYEDRCVKRCDKDTECPVKGYVCVDGVCHKPNWKTGKAPNAGKTQKKPLRVGLGVVKMDFPLGVSMGGFGFRPGPRGPYARSLGASTGMYDRFTVKAMILDNGVEQIVLIRSPLVFTTDFLVTQLTQKVLEKTGIDLTNKIIMTSVHSHSAPARFWNLLTHLNFGTFGGGDFLPEVFRRITNSFTEAVIKAQKNLQPGRVGYTIDPNFDPKGYIFSDRRSENSEYKEPRLLVMKVEKEDGTPLAVLVTFPMHGIISSNTMLTNDAAGGLEFKLQDRLEALEKKRIEVFFMQGAAGDVSPRGDKMGHKSTQQMQMVGTLASIHIEKLYKTIKTKNDIDLEIVNRRVPITYKDLGYKDGEFFSWVSGEKKVYRFGAFQCVAKGYSYEKTEVHKDGKLGCIFAIETLHGAAVPQFSKTHFSAARIGNLIISTFPGENTSHLARRLREGVSKNSGGKLKDVIVWGYSQDHQLYIVGEKDWWHGGYEASTTIWGPKVGEYFLKHAIELTSQLGTKEKEKNDTGILPIDFYKLDLSVNVPRKKTPDAGKVTAQPPKQYKLMAAPLQFTISGGFHGVDNPHVVLQQKNNGKFEDYKRPGGRLYDESDFRMIMTFAVKKEQNLYSFHFMELEGFPQGTFRFRFEGLKWDGSKRVPYTGNTDAFDIVPSDKLNLSGIKYDGKELHGWVSYPAGTNDDGKTPFPKIAQVGHRLRSHLVPWQVGSPLAEKGKVEIKITIKQGTKIIETLTADALNVRGETALPYVHARDKDGKETILSKKALASGFKIPTKQALAAGKYEVLITFKDSFGNTGVWGPKELVVK